MRCNPYEIQIDNNFRKYLRFELQDLMLQRTVELLRWKKVPGVTQ